MEYYNYVKKYDLNDIYVLKDGSIVLIIGKDDKRFYCQYILNNTPDNNPNRYMAITTIFEIGENTYGNTGIYYIDLNSIYNPLIEDFIKNEAYFIGQLTDYALEMYYKLYKKFNNNMKKESY